MPLGLVWAQSANGVIGRDGGLPWHLPEDLAHFKLLTTGGAVVMGRTTWDSLPASVRPLPGRRNVVLTRDRSWSADGAEVVHDVDAAVALVDGHGWVIGGGRVYAATLPVADLLEVTELAETFVGDVHAPEIGTGWTVAHRDPGDGWHTSRTGLGYRFVRYVRD